MFPSYLNASTAVSAYANSNPFVTTGGNSYGAYGTAVTGTEGTNKTAPGTGTAQQELSEISAIGYEKAAGYANGLGGTNNPDDHRLFYAA